MLLWVQVDATALTVISNSFHSLHTHFVHFLMNICFTLGGDLLEMATVYFKITLNQHSLPKRENPSIAKSSSEAPV